VDITLTNILIGLTGTIVVAITSYFGIVRKSRVDEIQIALVAWKELIEPLKNELINTKEEVMKLRAALEAADVLHEKETGRLMKRIRELEQVNRDRA
jgi:hypothetical protein